MQEVGDEDKQDKSGTRLPEHIHHIQLLEVILLQHPAIPVIQPDIQVTTQHLLQPGYEEGLRENIKLVDLLRLQPQHAQRSALPAIASLLLNHIEVVVADILRVTNRVEPVRCH